jgi:hypothetical protein
MYANMGPIIDVPVETRAEPEPKPLKERRTLTIEELYRLPITHCGDIKRGCIICNVPPTDFAVVKSAEIAMCYFFCSTHFSEYLHKPLAEKNEDDRRTSKRNAPRERTNNTNNRIDSGTTAREPILERTSGTPSGDSGSKQEDGRVETSGISARQEGLPPRKKLQS